jgi:sn-glycerol 3-phosphate transport system substrate-binding protein
MTRRLPVLALLLAVLVGATALAGCGGGDDDPGSAGEAVTADLPPCPLDALEGATGPVEVVVWYALQAKQEETFQQLAQEYNASQDRVQVRVESQGASDTELLRKFTAAVPSRQLPALVGGNASMTQLMADSGVVLPAQSCVDASGTDLSPFVASMRTANTIDGVLWPSAVSPSSMLLYYNRDHFLRAGLDPEQPPGTLAELRAAAEAIKAAGIVEKPFVQELRSVQIEYLLTGAGSTLVDNDNGRSAPATRATLTDNPTALEIFEWFADMQADGLLNAIPLAEGRVDQYLAMASGQASMLIEPSGSATSIEAFLGGTLDTEGLDGAAPADARGLDIDAGPFPGLEAPGRTQVSGPVWFLTSTTPPEVQAAAWDFSVFLNSEPAQVRQLTVGSFLPYRAAAADTPEAQTFFESSMAGQWLEIANDQMDDIDPDFPGPLLGPYDEARTALSDALAAMLIEGLSPADALARAQQEIDTAIEAYAAGGF